MKRKKSFYLTLFIIVLLTFSGMTLYEYFKQFLIPDISIWSSHIITIVFSTILAFVVSFFVLKRENKIKDALNQKNQELVASKTNLEENLKRLEEASRNIKILSGLIPICASCKKIRDDDGYWYQIEQYINEHSDAVFSHGLCPACAKKMYPDMKLEEKDN
ncbi:MAG TPA: hypothetical protein PLE16_00310 [Spirochaetota bacterium]|jgi:large-conductance mechanosensitive channel|nr:hypothetical protein [Spirochaetota bacterium]HOH37388.1 hypothetical protein [Spirochaetota bacterium]HPJ15397.1 hypothetical protein [Spirochaetota bacterium]HPM33019.1 hypothetical protein [Spirochaetota bacterium]HPY02265.1 hypothetical protein [Spirochaetota bacterium]